MAAAEIVCPTAGNLLLSKFPSVKPRLLQKIALYVLPAARKNYKQKSPVLPVLSIS